MTNGDEINAGSFFNDATSIGNDVPTNLATIIPKNKVRETNPATLNLAKNSGNPVRASLFKTVVLHFE